MKRVSKAELEKAQDRSVPDLVTHDLRLLLVGINPSLSSGATGFHFATPGNRLWPALSGAGLTARLLDPSETQSLLEAGIGITNLVNRSTRTAEGVRGEELRSGALRSAASAPRRASSSTTSASSSAPTSSTARWMGDGSASAHESRDRIVSRGVTDAEFTGFVKSTYRVLLTRGLRGCYVYIVDAPTRDFFLSRTEGVLRRASRIVEAGVG